MAFSLTSSQSTRSAEIKAIICALLLLVITTFAALEFSFLSEVRSFDRLAQTATQQINQQVTVAVGTLDSMAATHQASANGFEQRQFETFAEKLVNNQAAITAAGRYNTILHEDLDHYSSDLQESGIFAFTPKKLDSYGNLKPLNQKQQYQALLSFYPQDPVTAAFIGLDLSELYESNIAITKSTTGYAPFIATLPTNWIAAGHINIFTPTYYGHYAPDSENDRLLQTDGGYFISLDLETIVAHSTDTTFPMSVGISLLQNNYRPLVRQETKISDSRILGKFFKGKTIEKNLYIGAETATIIYRTPAGKTNAQLVSAFGKGLTALLLYLIGSAIYSAQRSSRLQIKANEQEIARARARALLTLNSLQDAIITTDSEDNIDYLNPAMLRVIKTRKRDLIGLNLHTVLDNHFKSTPRWQQASANGKNKTGGHSRPDSETKDSSLKSLINDASVIFQCHSSVLSDESHSKIGTLLTMRNISKEYALTTELEHQATHDALTGLPNRRKFEAILDDLLQPDSPEGNKSATVGYIDLDQFKLVNDTAGHEAGDRLLKKLAADLTTLVPENVNIARLGGDEFGFICVVNTDKCAENIARTFYNFFQNYHFQSEDHVFSIRASIGLTHIKPCHRTINEVLSEVDIACYTAKDGGRNNYVIYDANDKETKHRKGEMLFLPALQSALKENRFELYTQPIVSTQTDTPVAHHHECLLRLVEEDGSIVTPYKFIVAAERYDLIGDIDRWVLENAMLQISEFKNTALHDTIFSINLSGQSAVDTGMPGFVDNMLRKYDIDSTNICFELTETAVIGNFTQAQKLIAFLRERGCTIALDDFGAGASSFGYLKNLEVDYLKIDGQFVKEMTSNKVDFEMVRSMNNVGDALGIKTIAEFVENQETMQALSEINVDYAQGYFIGKPSPMTNLLQSTQLPKAA